MKVKTVLGKEIEKCNDCPHHEVHDICTADSFENETGIYCGETDDFTDSWERYTYGGRIDKRLSYSYDTWESSEAPVPNWCPLLIEQYVETEDKLKALLDKKKTTWCTHIYGPAVLFLKMLEDNWFKGFFYHASFQPTKRDYHLAIIAALYSAAPKDTDLNLELSDEDMKIIEAAIKQLDCSANGQDLAESFKRVKDEAKGKIFLPALKTDLAVPMAILLARRLMGPVEESYTPLDMHQKIEFSLVGQEDSPIDTAELRYTIDKKYNIEEFANMLKRGDNPNYVLIPRFIAKDILGLKHFNFYINDEKISITKFTNIKH